jgi:hypothetical protein
VFQFPRVFTTVARKEIYFSKLIVERKFIIRRCGVVSFSLVIRKKKNGKSIKVHFKAALRTLSKRSLENGNENLSGKNINFHSI